MTNKASNQQDEIWTVIAKGLVEAVKMVFSIFLFVFTAGKSRDSTENIREENGIGELRNGHSGYGYYVNGMRTDTDDE
ncbi:MULTISPECIES: DUF3742 family protein [Enterobacterales]|uniref:DUF3742 family protein n=2 Tax=Yersinia TaxID=629 RepID=A0A857EX69_9GAMM|nr:MULTISPECIES: DUF3742 family protein [Enterobacterales]EKN3394057.1 DUF3742 family protein [Yersinia enterocolitica]EKN3528195.1 DUF3742 family protein [Yersinia enterocolitica]EKN3635466.1 DUF3742 family protein [Yersinia enterocolitica]EKN3831571.1 DUF3742 family protein [Yersinia enterocolitica]EKN4763583.1 DUF3742 family protein [Yersinia enterocolitica]